MDFMPLQGVKLRFAVAGRRACICGPDSPQPATAGPATAKRGFTISITTFCRVRTNKNNEAKRCLSSGFPEQPVENIRIYTQELQRNYGTYAGQYAGRPQSTDGERYFNNIEIRNVQDVFKAVNQCITK